MSTEPQPATRRQGRSGEVQRLAQPLIAFLGAVIRHVHWPLTGLALLYLGSGVTFVDEGERAVVLRWGRAVGDSPAQQVHPPGLLLAWPAPIDRVVRVGVEKLHEVEVNGLDLSEERLAELDGMLSGGPVFASDFAKLPQRIDPERDGSFLTGDRGILHQRLLVRYRVADPLAFALREAQPEALVRSVVQAAAVHIGAGLSVERIFADDRGTLPGRIETEAQRVLDTLECGLRIEWIEASVLSPPPSLIPEFLKVDEERIAAKEALQNADRDARTLLARATGEGNQWLSQARSDRLIRLTSAYELASRAQAYLALEGDARRVTFERLEQEAFRSLLERVGPKVRYVSPPDGDSYSGLRISLVPGDLGAGDR